MEQEASEVFEDETEVGESYFGGSQKGKGDRGAARKMPVLDILKRGGKVHSSYCRCKVSNVYADYQAENCA